MSSYRFYPSADRAQDDIWNYTLNQWGEAQAERYIRQLHQHLQRLADREIVWRSLPRHLVVPADLKTEVYMSRYQRHYIFFRELSQDAIGVMSILHEAIDLPVRLRKDLEKIDLIETS